MASVSIILVELLMACAVVVNAFDYDYTDVVPRPVPKTLVFYVPSTTPLPPTTTSTTVYKAHQPGKYWSRSQCSNMDRFDPLTLESCKTKCTSSNGCTALEYNAGSSKCVLRSCSIPAPEPTISDSDWVGYSIDSDATSTTAIPTTAPTTTVYKVHQSGKVWSLSQCSWLNIINSATLENCKTNCTSHNGCTAFEYNAGSSECHLFNCTIPAPEPTESYYGWVGYYVVSVAPSNTSLPPTAPQTTVYKAHQPGQTWINNQCSFLVSFIRVSLETCKSNCISNNECTAFHYNTGISQCRLLHCPVPAPEPFGNNEGWIGYSLDLALSPTTPTVYKTQQSKYWYGSQCPYVNTIRQATLERCKTGCTSSNGCTAFNYFTAVVMCDLFNCTIPAPEPSGTSELINGYSIDPAAPSTTVTTAVDPPTTYTLTSTPLTAAPPTTNPPTTYHSTTAPLTTAPPITDLPSTAPLTTAPPTKALPTTATQTTVFQTTVPLTIVPPTIVLTTKTPPTTSPPTTAPPNTIPTTGAPTTPPPTTEYTGKTKTPTTTPDC